MKQGAGNKMQYKNYENGSQFWVTVWNVYGVEMTFDFLDWESMINFCVALDNANDIEEID